MQFRRLERIDRLRTGFWRFSLDTHAGKAGEVCRRNPPMKPDRKNFHLIVALALLGAIVFCPAQMVPASDYPVVCGPCNLSFPRDHGSHPDYRIEWWYYTGNLRSEDGAVYGFQLTFFRIRTVPVQKESVRSGRQSAWRTDQVFAAHAALSDISSNEFFHSEKMSRAALKLAGAKQEDGRFEVFVNGWRAAIAPGLHNLSARAADFSFNLDLVPLKSPVAHGESGLSSKGRGTRGGQLLLLDFPPGGRWKSDRWRAGTGGSRYRMDGP